MNKLFLLSFIVLFGCSNEGFQPVTTSTARVIGRVVYDDDRPAGDFPVHFTIDGRRTSTVRTDDFGVFAIEDAAAGPAVIVAHDGAGNGARRALTVYAGGDNDAGTLVVGALSLVPDVLDIRGIAYEERILAVTGRNHLVAIAPDGAPILIAYDDPVAPNATGRLLRVDVETGTTEELVPGLVVIAAEPRSDRILIADQPDRRGAVAIDLISRTVFYTSESTELVVYSGSVPIWPISDGIFAVEAHYPEAVTVFAGFDGRRVQGPRFDRSATLITATEEHIYFAATDDTTTLGTIDRRSMEVRELGEIPVRGVYNTAVVTREPGKPKLYALALLSVMGLISVDLASGAHQELCLESCGMWQGNHGGIDVDETSGELVVLAGPSQGQVLRVDAGDRVRAEQLEIDPASPAMFCFDPMGRGPCSLNVFASNHLRVAATHRDAEDNYRGMIADVIDGRVSRVIEWPVDVNAWPPLAWVEVLPVAGRNFEVVSIPDTSGNHQLSLGPIGRDLSMFRPLTFLGGNRVGPRISPDQRYVYYLLEDPVRTGFALFRAELQGGE